VCEIIPFQTTFFQEKRILSKYKALRVYLSGKSKR